MVEIGAEAARKKLPELLERAHGGETSIIKKRGVPYAALVPLGQLIDPGMSDGLLSLWVQVKAYGGGMSQPLSMDTGMSGSDRFFTYPERCPGYDRHGTHYLST